MKKSIIICSGVLLSILSSCSDSFLDVKPKAALTLDALQTNKGVNSLLVGAYSLLDGWATPEGAYRSYQVGADNWVYGSVASDDAYKGTIAGDQPPISLIEQGNISSDNIYFRGKWRGMYDGIARTNDVLQTLAKVTDITDAERTQITAEARFLRGHYHFELKKMFNMVPYIDETIYDPNNLESTKKPNTEDIWPKIMADLTFAYENLPVKQTQPGRASKWAAGATMAKAYLFQKKFAEAKPLLEAIVASNQFRLVDRYHDNFRAVTNNNAESIFEVQYSVNDGASGGENGNIGSTLNYPYGGGGVTTCCGFFQPSQNLVNAFKTGADGLPLLDTFNAEDVTNDQGIEATQPFTPYTGTVDPRLDWTVGRRGIPFLDWGVHPGKTYVRDQAYGGPYSPKKHVMYRSDVGTNTFAGNPRLNANNYRLIRYSHVLLWLAEVETELNNLEAARGYVNQIRRRAANPDGFVKTTAGTPAANYVISEYTTPWTDQALARKAVQFEERLEFGMEGHRRFDLVRWGIAAETLNNYYATESKKRSYLAGVQFIPGKHEYFPIPLQEIFNSKVNGQNTLTQNPGY
ncbi:RagB/SusD family nutrient uptake outer membrane protein [Adhaeribacter swui]|uniref:RagB/SusD family nutrient uptake outer membrane protein n=1 Tax=Adhaeribacter swui TaxID=2086471 RepID=A0A7G7G7I8_9BACT|nr:RagB/SusD family nutrient uptake outer membrane protein [Adhaeribacter swui]QNF33122.1 RagB/SusD family nutrient uptake outer membrane protein [Adhaeribacter swui]